jgi:hypothetical protein
MSDLFWLSEAQICRIEPYFSRSCGAAIVRVPRGISEVIFVLSNGLR